MRKLIAGGLAAALVLALAAVAYAVTNTMSYKSTTKASTTKVSSKKPGNLAYRGTLKIQTDPPDQQPDTAPTTEIHFADGIRNNAKYFPSCTRAEIDGKQDIPRKCNKAVVGTGTAEAYAGTPGNPRSQSVHERLTVKAINGPRGRQIFLAVTSEPGAPVTLNHRVVPGTVKRSSSVYGFAVRFDIPADLQEQLGLKISLTDFDVRITSRARRLKVGRRFKRISYLQVTKCRGGLPYKAITKFKDASSGQLTSVTSTGKSRC